VEILTSGSGRQEPRRPAVGRGNRPVCPAGNSDSGTQLLGIYCPESGLTILPGQNFSRRQVLWAFFPRAAVSARTWVRLPKGWEFGSAKWFSYGNGCDLAACDLLEYFFADPKTGIIAGYLEGVEDGPRFLKILRENKGKSPSSSGSRVDRNGKPGGDEPYGVP